MILEEETFETFGHCPRDLLSHSDKGILAVCDNCCMVRITSKHDYHSSCKSCSKKGNNHPMYGKHPWNFGKPATKEMKAKNSVAHKGEKHPNYGKHLKDETKGKQSAAMKGEKNHNYKGGKKIAHARNHAKRKQQLGYTLLLPLKDGEAGHHVTNEFVIGIPADVHQQFSGGGRKKHRTKVLYWLKANDKKKYKLALCVLAKE